MAAFTAYLAEFLGTFLLLISILATGNALVIGLTLSLIIFLVGGLSGANVNPAVSLAMLINGSLSVTDFVVYSIVQLAGGAAAVYVFNALA
jgi:glycerol uptake facilitator-like aquaporin